MSQQQPLASQQGSQFQNTMHPPQTGPQQGSQQSQSPQQSQPPQQGQQSQQSQPPQQGQRSQGGQQSQQGSPTTQASFPTRNVLPQQVRSESVETLNRCLADATVIFTQCKTAHWNVKGPDFYQLHELFDDVAELLEAHVDDIAERVTALGGLAAGTAHEAAQTAQVPEYPVTATDERTVIESVADSLAAFDATLQEAIQAASARNDLDTADLLNDVSREVSKALWFVEAHLQGESGQREGGASAQMGQADGPM